MFMVLPQGSTQFAPKFWPSREKYLSIVHETGIKYLYKHGINSKRFDCSILVNFPNVYVYNKTSFIEEKP